LLSRAIKYIFLVVFPIVLTIVTFAPEGLSLWLGPTFSAQGTAVLRWTAAGVFVNSLSILPFVLLQSAGRPDITAWLMVCELPLYAASLWFLTRWLGVEGTAVAWTARISIEAVVLLVLSKRIVPQGSHYVLRLSGMVAGGLAIIFLACVAQSLAGKVAFLCSVLSVFGLAVWSWALTPRERRFVFGHWAEASVRNSSQLG
jgi:O-antigen/teichoic acid export membrane protein